MLAISFFRQKIPALKRIVRTQGQRLQQWRRICLRGTAVMGLAWLGGLGLLGFADLPLSIWVAVAAPTALMPLLIALHWLFAIPRVWGVDGRWVGLAVFAASAMLALFGHWFATLTLNEIFHDNPALFPVARAAATYFGAVFGLIAVLVFLLLVIFFMGSGAILFCAIVQGAGKRGLLKRAGTLAAVALAIGATLGSLDPLERLSRHAVLQVALAGDFLPRHRCNMDGWPTGITRVAFVGDQQVLGYRAADRSISVLACPRITE